MKVKLYRVVAGAITPRYATDGAVGLDLHALLDSLLPHGESATVRTGIAIALPDLHEAQVRPRSGLTKRGVVAMLGTIDADYRGEISVTLRNFGRDFEIEKGMRIAQLVVAPIARVEFDEVYELAALGQTDRGEAGFGSTGLGGKNG